MKFRGLKTEFPATHLNDAQIAEIKAYTNVLRVGALKPRFLSLYSDKN